MLRDAGGLFGGGPSGGAARRRRGDDVDVERPSLDCAEAVYGVTRTVEVGADVSCETLRRQRRRAGHRARACPQCHGSGQVREVSSLGGFGQFIRTSTCNVCQGQGTIVERALREVPRHRPHAAPPAR